ncbi:hypothetical protein C8J35_1332 [Rhizobium sp. PP-F2F-G38]|nr:hypothetical protein C8J35_1332 [Rhizobium sp. PP-F2F-G38]
MTARISHRLSQKRQDVALVSHGAKRDPFLATFDRGDGEPAHQREHCGRYAAGHLDEAF